MSLLQKLSELNESDILPLHMPGHKRNVRAGVFRDILDIDITEIDGFDDLHNPEGVILDMEKQAARLYGAKHAYISVNGSTAANQAAILGMCPYGSEIMLPRASHKSIYYALELGQYVPVYLPHRVVKGTSITDAVRIEDVVEAYEAHPDCKCVVITSPTYEGISADVKAIADVVHSHNGVLIVDSAHGAHIGLNNERLCEGALSQGADLVIVSLHKTLPSPTQTALLLSGNTECNVSLVEHYMKVFQSSSPSYILMAGVGECLNYIEDRFPEDMNVLLNRISKLEDELARLRHIDIRPIRDNDPTKIIIQSDSISGYDMHHTLLDTYHIQCEMYSTDYCLAMLSVMDGVETFDRLAQALKQIDDSLEDVPKQSRDDAHRVIPQTVRVMSAREAMEHKSASAPISDKLVGRVAAGYVMEYPPGIPVLVPGELIDERVITYINKGLEKHLNIYGIDDNQMPVVEL